MYLFILVFPTQLEAPSKCEKVDELCEAEEAEASAQTSQTTERGDEVFNSVDHVLVVLDDGLVLEVHVEQGQVLLLHKLVLLVGPELLHDPACLAGEARHAVGCHILRVGAGRWAEASGVLYKVFTLFKNIHKLLNCASCNSLLTPDCVKTNYVRLTHLAPVMLLTELVSRLSTVGSTASRISTLDIRHLRP